MNAYSPADEMNKKHRARRKKTHSLMSRLFEWSLIQIWPKTDSMLKAPQRGLGYIIKWIRTIRRKTYYPILNVWSNYCHGIEIDEEGNRIKGARVRLTGFILWNVLGAVGWIAEQIYIRSGLAPWICKRYGHKLVDHSSAGPDSGNADHGCDRCGEYWHYPLY